MANFVHFNEARGPNQIDRFQRQRKVTIVANLAATRPWATPIKEGAGVSQENGIAARLRHDFHRPGQDVAGNVSETSSSRSASR
jgi:multidrug efflux pump subunit AcrB